MTVSGVGLPGHQAGTKISGSRIDKGFESGHRGGPAGLAEKCRSSEKVQVCRKSAGAAGGAARTLRSVGVLAGIALLSACAGKVETQIQYVRVEVPVQVPCRAPEVAVPSWAAAGLRKTDSLEVKVRALLAERRQRIGYEKQLAAAVGACR